MSRDILPETIPAFLRRSIAERGDHVALHVPQNDIYEQVTWRQLTRDIGRMAALLQDLDVGPGTAVTQISANRYEWIVSDLAILSLGAVHVPLQSALSGSQMAHQIIDSESTVVLLAGAAIADRLAEQAELDTRIRLLAYDDWPQRQHNRLGIELLAEMACDISDRRAGCLERGEIGHVAPEDLATLLYTSGTMGWPKGVMLSHRNLASNAAAVCAVHGTGVEEVQLCILPLCHVYSRTCGLNTWLFRGSQLALARSPETLEADLQQIRPTLLNAVPYLYEKLVRPLRRASEPPRDDALITLLGGRIRRCFSGGAALPDDLAHFYERYGVPLLQGYGLSESSPVITSTRREHYTLGAVGQPLPGVEVRIADDGEILTRGPHVMLGYWKDPKATARVIDNGWLRTGDLGSLDEDGRLTIRGRKKEILVTATGKNIVPSFLEGLLTSSPLIEQAMVIGEGRKYLVALIVPDRETLAEESAASGMAAATPQQLLNDARTTARFRVEIDARLQTVARHEQIGRFELLARPFSVTRGELSPKLSLRRDVIRRHCADTIDALYTES
jgi:long-chain acyl-CoA synthetase